ncbi:MAG: hypothetical protein Q9224_001827, partial [Gallowayella concinna]
MSLVPVQRQDLDITYQGYSFAGFNDIAKFLRNYNNAERYQILCNLRDQFMEQLEDKEHHVAVFYENAIQDPGYLAHSANDLQSWQPMADVQKKVVSTRHRIETATQTVLSFWPDAGRQGLFPNNPSHGYMDQMRKAARGYKFEEAKQRLVAVITDRVTDPRAGRRAQVNPTPQDWANVVKMERRPIPPVDFGLLQAFDLELN